MPGHRLRNAYGAHDRAGIAAAMASAPRWQPLPKARRSGVVQRPRYGRFIHGLFGSDTFRSRWLADHGAEASALDYEARTEAAIEALADHCEENLDLDALLTLAR